MKLAFVAFRYFPYGGLERDMLAMARTCQQRGHEVLICVGSWEGNKPDDVAVKIVAGKKHFTNAGHNAGFIKTALPTLRQQGYTLIGFNKMPGLDFYYAADTCFAAKAYGERGRLYRATARARQYLAHEKAVFSPASRTHCFMISRHEMEVFKQYYHTPQERLHPLPPAIHKTLVMPPDYAQRRLDIRKKLGILPKQTILLMVGSDFKRKGVDRSIEAFAGLPPEQKEGIELWVAGKDNAAPFQQIAHQYNVDTQVKFLGPRDDVPELMWAADVFLHPARSENTGTVILEAMVAGLPAIVTDVCGYAHYVTDWELGRVISSPYHQDNATQLLLETLSHDRDHWTDIASIFAKEDIYSMTERAADIIESKGTPA